MSRKWLEQEGNSWVEQQIITQEQYERLLGLYGERKNVIGILPILGSVLVGLGILSFIAANWQNISEWLRLLLVIAVMTGFYLGGERLLAKGHEKLGIAIVGLGLISFGGGIVLVGQMFHLISYTSAAFVVWGLVGALIANLYRSHYLFFISLIIFNVAQMYSTVSLNYFSYMALILMVLSLGYYVVKQPSSLLIWFLSLSGLFQAMLFLVLNEWKMIWLFVPALILYAAGDWLRNVSRLSAIQSAPLLVAYIFSFIIVVLSDLEGVWLREDLTANAKLYIPIMLVLFVLSAVGKWRNKRESSSFEWILFLPIVYLPSQVVGFITLIAMFAFSLYVLWRGYAEEWRFKINAGTLLFLFSSMVAYVKLTWSFMDKSLFFIIGGILLLVLSWQLNKRRREFLDDSKEG